MMNNLIKGNIATILNEREVVINRGSKDGVEIGMIFKILAETPIPIYDPKTKEPLGKLDREKTRVKCIEIQERLSVCTTYIKRVHKGINSLLATQAQMEDRTVVDTFRYDSSDKPQPISEEESYVKIGDRCIQVIETNEK